MTSGGRMPPDGEAMTFLLEEFIEVSDGAKASGVERLQEQAARALLPGPRRGAKSLQQLGLMGMPAAEFQQLRRDVRDWIRSLRRSSHVGLWRTLNGPLRLCLIAPPGHPNQILNPLIEGPVLDVFWFYLTHLLSRVGIGRIWICWAPRSQKVPAQQALLVQDGVTEYCGRLFLRRGGVKRYCSKRCRDREATARSRKKRR
jgi:hypothetical protein